MKTITKATVIFAILLLELFGAPFYYVGVRAQQYYPLDYPGNSCLSFNGVDNSVHTSDFQPTNLTLEAWVKPKYTIKFNSSSPQYYNHSDGYVISDFVDTAYMVYPTGWWLRFVYDDGTLRFGWYYGTSGYSVEYAATRVIWYNDTWYHIAVTFNPTLPSDNLKFYINGTLDYKITNGNSIRYWPLEAYLQIGGYLGRNSYYGGLIDEVRVWNTSRESSEIGTWWNRTERAIPSASNNLWGYWRFDNVSVDGITNDFSLYGHDGQVLNAQLVTPGGPVYQFYDLNFDGKIDIRDIAIVAKAFGTILGLPGWNPLADLNEDGKVDIRDIAIVAKHFGEY